MTLSARAAARRLALLLLCATLPGVVSVGGCRKADSRAAPGVAPPVSGAERTTKAGAGAPAPPPPLLAAKSVRFEEVASESGLNFRWTPYPRPLRNREAFGRGCAFLDYDGDGWQDVLLVGSPRVGLFRNRTAASSGRPPRTPWFQDVTEATGLSRIQGDWIGCAAGDYDGDGDLDILLTGYHRLALLQNTGSSGGGGGGRFRDATAGAGLSPNNGGHWGSSAGFMDLDGDGALDLVVLNYVVFGPGEKQFCELAPGVVSGCPPSVYRPEFGEVWRNRGGGRFERVNDALSGMKETSGKALVVAFSDVDDDARADFYVGNDGTPAELMHNRGGMRLENVGAESGVAFGADGKGIAAMGADWGDYDRDGRPDLIVTAFSDEPYALFHNLGDALFENEAATVGIAGPTLKPLGFGVKWLDADNDGWLDIVIANGHVYDNVDRIYKGQTFRQKLMLFHNDRGQRFTDLIPAMAGGALAEPLLGRGLATADFDNDGRTDFLVVADEDAPRLFHNRSAAGHHWVTFDLRSPRGKNRLAYGAKVTARAGNEKAWVAEVSPASSYLSSSDPRVHFGLGGVRSLRSVTVRWPSGETQTWRGLPVDRVLTLTEGEKAVR